MEFYVKKGEITRDYGIYHLEYISMMFDKRSMSRGPLKKSKVDTSASLIYLLCQMKEALCPYGHVDTSLPN